MNPLSNVKSLNKLNEREIELGVVGTNSSWHKKYRESAWIFFGGVPYELTEGDLICVFSQYGEIVNVNLVRDKKTGKSKGFGFVCYEDQRSTDLAVDNFNGIKLVGRIMRVDHVLDYRPPKDDEDEDDIITQFLQSKGCAPETIQEKLKQLKDSKQEKKPETQSQSNRHSNKNYRRRSRSRSRGSSSDDTKNKYKEIKIKKEPTSDEEREKKKKREERDREKRDSHHHHHRSDRDRDRDRDGDRDRHHHDHHKSHSRHRSRSRDKSRSTRSRTPSRSMSSHHRHHKHHNNR